MPHDTKPHDTFFKHHFSHKKAIEGFLRNRLPKELVETLDFTTLKRQPDSFLPTDYLGRREVDVLWAINTKSGDEIDFFMHFEAEGTPQEMAMRVLMYQAIIGDTFLKQNKGAKIPTIITFVLYHGQKPWVGAKSIADAYKNHKQQIKFGFETPFVIDLRTEPTEKIKADGKIAPAELMLAGQAKGDMFACLPEAIANSYLPCCEKRLIYYCLSKNKDKEHLLFEIIHNFSPSKANHYRNMLQELKQNYVQEGIQQGRQEGIQQGIQQGRQEGRQEGLQEGRQEGLQEGITNTMAVLRRKGFNEYVIREVKDEVQQFTSQPTNHGV